MQIDKNPTSSMTDIAKYRRARMLKRMATARRFQRNAELYQGVGGYYRKQENLRIVILASAVIAQGAKVRIYALRALALLRLWMGLRAYAWPLLARNSSTDFKFWQSRLIPAYRKLESTVLELVQLAEPDQYQALRKKTTHWPEE